MDLEEGEVEEKRCSRLLSLLVRVMPAAFSPEKKQKVEGREVRLR